MKDIAGIVRANADFDGIIQKKQNRFLQKFTRTANRPAKEFNFLPT